MRATLRLAFALGVAAAAPAQAETVYVGTFAVTSATTACGTAAGVGDFARLVYRPAYAGFGNGADSYLAWIPSRSSYAMTTPNNTFRALINYAGQSVGSTLNVATKTGGITQWSQSPATPTTATRSINLLASLTNFFAISGCTVTIRGSLLHVKSNAGDVIN